MAAEGTQGRRETTPGAHKRRLRLPETDAYGLVFLMIIATLWLTATRGDQSWGRVAAVVIQGATLLLILWTSQARSWVRRASTALVAVGIAAAAISALVGEGAVDLEVTHVVPLLLAVLAPAAIVLRIVEHPVVTLKTILAALCLYLLIGFFFATLFGAVQKVDQGVFFAQEQNAGSSDFIYFSYVTLATLGYGDLTPVTEAGRMLAVSEAILGQLYLVSVVALLIGNLGQPGRKARKNAASDT
ncbi:MAG: potassium channel family protein [Actinomycetota bacterium]